MHEILPGNFQYGIERLCGYLVKTLDFSCPSGRIEEVPHGVAFVPATLKSGIKLEYSSELLSALSEAEHYLGRLDGIGQRLSDPGILINPFLRREAVLSSKIEGTHTSYSDVILFEAATRTNDHRDDNTRQVVNYVQALDFGYRQCRLQGTIDDELIFAIHRTLMKGPGSANSRSGKLRTDQVHVRGNNISVARYVPPPAEYLPGLMADLTSFISANRSLPLLIRIGLVHYQFEAIHPFNDGNGRVGRLLITLILCLEQRLTHPLLYLSAYFERNSEEYYNRLLAVSQRSSWTDWISFFINGIREEARDAVRRTSTLFDLQKEYRSRFDDSRASAPTRLIDHLFESPVMTIPRAQILLGVSYPSAKKIVSSLIERGILRPMEYEARAQYFIADEIINVIEQAIV